MAVAPRFTWLSLLSSAVGVYPSVYLSPWDALEIADIELPGSSDETQSLSGGWTAAP